MNNKRHPLVSVVIPMFNVEKYIEQAVQSVLKQTFKNFEIVCVDDGCTDNTISILERLSDPRIRLIRQKNRGLSGARNTGIFAANGIYIALLDADDYWAPDKLSLHVKHLNSRPNVDISYSPSLFVDDEGNDMGLGQFPKLTDITFRDVLCRNPIGNGSAPVIRKTALLSHTFETDDTDHMQIFNESLRQSEDIELWVRMAKSRVNNFEGIPKPLTYYRVNAGGLSANLNNQYRSWFKAISNIMQKGDSMTKAHFSLAKAYQQRYLARRAIQSGNAMSALRLVHMALFTNPKILIEEPARTCATYGCAFLSLLPQRVYKALEKAAISLSASQLSPRHLPNE